jgi:hypothetical protein
VVPGPPSPAAPETPPEAAQPPQPTDVTEEAILPPAPREPSPFAALPTDPVGAVRAAFDLLSRATNDVRRGSFYIGGLVLATIGPLALLAWGLEVASEGRGIEDVQALFEERVGGWVLVAGWIAIAGLVTAFIHSRGTAVSLLGARLDGRRFGIREALLRSRLTFWPVLGGLILVNIPVVIGQALISDWLGAVFGAPSEVTAITPGIVTAILAAPLAYVVTGIVLGNVGAIESIRRSVTLFRARPASAVVVSLFALAAQYLTVFAALAGVDIIARVFESLNISAGSGDLAIALITLAILAGVFALGSLMFTVTALGAAPQVVMFLALTHTTLGLDSVPPIATADGRFRWLTAPTGVLSALGIIVAIGGLVALNV